MAARQCDAVMGAGDVEATAPQRRPSGGVAEAADAVWRVPPSPSPLAAGNPTGPLGSIGTSESGRARVAVKDLFAVAGQRVGAGNPAWLAAAPVESSHAWAVAALLEAGAEVTGIAQTDELAFSLAGTNVHYGTPPNAAAPGRLTGGSTNGPAAAVAAGAADVGLGTDTAGSIRVPASYCGLYGLRTTHGAVPRDGLVGLASSFDTVGVLAGSAQVLRAAASALLPAQPVAPVARVLLSPPLLELVAEPVRAATRGAASRLAAHAGAQLGELDLDDDARESWFEAFRMAQSAEAWAEHGGFVSAHPGELEPAIEARFVLGSQTGAEELAAARGVLAAARSALVELLPVGTVLALPSTASPAPLVDEVDAVAMDQVRAATLRLTCLASLAGLPALSLPLAQVDGLPLGLCLVAAPGQDRTLLALA